jgi:glucose-6-phosphate 1-dehydrogenase
MKNLIKTSLVITLLISAPSIFGMAETQKNDAKQQETSEKKQQEVPETRSINKEDLVDFAQQITHLNKEYLQNLSVERLQLLITISQKSSTLIYKAIVTGRESKCSSYFD